MTPHTQYLEAFTARIPDASDGHERAQLRETFMHEFASNIAEPDLDDRDPAHDARVAGELWLRFERREGKAPLIEVTNPPDDDRYSIVTILHPDMPFITDSVLMDLSRHALVLHFLHNFTLTVVRDAQGFVQALPGGRGPAREVLIHAEIDRVPDGELDAIRNRLEAALADVRAAVADYEAMQNRLRALVAELATAPDAEAQQAVEFLDWLVRDHFTFLGYREFEFGATVRQVPGSALGVLRNRLEATERAFPELRESARRFLRAPARLAFSKGGTRSLVHRHAYPDYVAVKRFDAEGNVTGECGFLGLYTSPVYRMEPDAIPVVRGKVRNVLAASKLDPKSFDGKALVQVLATYPRDELLQTPQDELAQTANAIAHIHERRQTKLFMRQDDYGLFVTALVYMPRELFNTSVRLRIQELLMQATQALGVEFDTVFSESILVRLQLTMRVDPDVELDLDVPALEREIIRMSQDWELVFGRKLKALRKGEREKLRPWIGAFSPIYRQLFDVTVGLEDAQRLASLDEEHRVATRFYRPPDFGGGRVRLKVFHNGGNLPLSTILPILENLGFDVIGEHPFDIRPRSRIQSIQDLELRYPGELDLDSIEQRFNEAFVAAWLGRCENDAFNRLVLSAGLTWREAALLRAFARYTKQIRFGFGQTFIAETLNQHPRLAALLVRCFAGRFDPDGSGDAEHLDREFVEGLNAVALFNEDKVLRLMHRLVLATVRTNWFQMDAGGAHKAIVAFKLASRQVPEMPHPVPEYEIFVYGVELEGVHLRSSRVARGGIRASDRLEDYRTEILALLKTQVVKNAVIVPTGAKGGFVVKRDTSGFEPEALRAEVKRVYELFIGTLLDITDNLVDGQVVRPSRVRCHDAPDPYLVVAADKGTATFSDVANGLARAHGYWLGDAFASGGSNGYDHKAMGITAKGAWVCVRQHFRELGLDPERDPITMVGIGDMSGDVFGNGLLRSRTARLVAAFNHQHIFLDPDPDAEASFAERERLFELPRSGWADYDPALISRGGGVYPRTRKTVDVSKEAAARLDIQPGKRTPDELIRSILAAPVDLLWNGGIGTYVKASYESHADAADLANDAVRIDALSLRSRVVGEGGNLGFTAQARVEYALAGGAINADFIDNAGGVDCSDHEVNIKILLDGAIAAGELTARERNAVLDDAELPVERAVLDNNARQALALSLAVRHVATYPEEYARFIRHLEREGRLDRKADAIPTDDELRERAQRQQPLTRPELATLLSYAKIELEARLREGRLGNRPAFLRFMDNTFPGTLRERFPRACARHQLANEIVCTRAANEVIDHLGMTFVHRLMEFVGCSALDVVTAYTAVAAIYELPVRWDAVEAVGADAPIRFEIQFSILLDLLRLGRTACRWLARRHRGELDADALTERYGALVRDLTGTDPERFLGAAERERRARRIAELEAAGVPEPVAHANALAPVLVLALPIVDAVHALGVGIDPVVTAFVQAGERLGLARLASQMSDMPLAGHWQLMERDTLLDDLIGIQMTITRDIVTDGGWDRWRDTNQRFHDAFNVTMGTGLATGEDLAHAAMLVRRLQDQMPMLEPPA